MTASSIQQMDVTKHARDTSALEAGFSPDHGQARPAHAAAATRTTLRLLIAAHFVYAGRVGGAEHMLYNLLRGLSRECSDVTVLCASERNMDPAAVEQLRRHPSLRIRESGGGGPRFLAEQRACLDPSVAGDAILFPNYFVPPITPRRLGRIVTVLHDMQYRHFPANFSAKKRAWLRAAQNLAVLKADRVVVISNFVRDDALRVFGKRVERKLSVIPNPIDWSRFAGHDGDRTPVDRPYVLSVAAQYPHKNLEVLVRAFARVAERNRDPLLVLCGQDYGGLRGVAGARTGLRPLIESLGIQDRVRLTGYVDDATLGHYYRHATAFAFPSVFEGFGMPAVEALGMGLPTLTTRETALPETTMGVAQYLDDPFSVAEWASRLEVMLRSPEQFRPTDEQVVRLQERYRVDRIARAYAQVCAH
ncbi:glycosyltransferase family 4 protein [Roseomonas elaeocarpi]|uniref:Glycosyltransferase family 4 protein n=1 Tax=Roseomonas elaeocarpi TaxID=907779 RepID=A0ABV6JLX6_9PROT